MTHGQVLTAPAVTKLRSKREQRLRHDLRQSLAVVMTLASVVDTDPLEPTVGRRLEQIRNELDWMGGALAENAEVAAVATVPPVQTVPPAQTVPAPPAQPVVIPGQMRREVAVAPATCSPVDVGAVTAELWESAVPGSRCRLRLVREGWGLARVDRGELRRSVRNLLDNALRAAGDGGQVELRVSTTAGTVVVEVADSGPGFGLVPTQQGLGLITVRRFAAAAGGRLSTGRCPQLGGALLRLELPLATGGRS